MDWNDIERRRVHGFTVARRGYDRREVDKFVAALGDWIETDAGKDLGDQAVKRKLELVGKSTAHILLTTEQEAEALRAQTEEECAELRSQADAASAETRRAADEYAKKVRDRPRGAPDRRGGSRQGERDRRAGGASASADRGGDRQAGRPPP
jgi:hypothetical protein